MLLHTDTRSEHKQEGKLTDPETDCNFTTCDMFEQMYSMTSVWAVR